MSNEQQRDAEKPIRIRIKYGKPSPEMAEYANELSVINTGIEFIITFYRHAPAYLSAEDRAEMERGEIDSDAVPVARVIIPNERMGKFLEVLMDNYQGIMNRPTPPGRKEGEQE